jgi:hypothetical protein
MNELKDHNSQNESGEHGDKDKDKPVQPEPGPEVHITVNNTPRLIHRGRRTVAEIKKVGGVPLADELDQLIDKKLTSLPDDGSVVIKGGEVFISHVRSGGSS